MIGDYVVGALFELGALSSLTCMSMHHGHIESYENVKGGVLLHR